MVSGQDTVPFALWSAACHLNDYEEALWATVSGLGDRDMRDFRHLRRLSTGWRFRVTCTVQVLP
jgi:hypothetical protein